MQRQRVHHTGAGGGRLHRGHDPWCEERADQPPPTRDRRPATADVSAASRARVSDGEVSFDDDDSLVDLSLVGRVDVLGYGLLDTAGKNLKVSSQILAQSRDAVPLVFAEL
ncbi:hypothetical protein ACGF0D_43405 [Kitasatospora sp. NPDC048298]|uniref:hypothetical protein n=1 Tax=Kitasatospora sp. NPDC048298 TaxID=3364049 RepID=UPI00371704D8